MHWIIVTKDKEGAAELRAATRDAHRAYIWRTDLAVRLLLGAPLAADDGTTALGSWLLVEAADRAAVEAFVAQDPYVLAGLPAEIKITALHKGFDASRIAPR
jgi:uncharacterized protein YciI